MKLKAVLLEAGAINNGDISLSELSQDVDLTIYENTTEEDKYEHIGDAQIIFDNKIIMDEEVFEKCPNIEYIGICATGYNVVDIEAARKRISANSATSSLSKDTKTRYLSFILWADASDFVDTIILEASTFPEERIPSNIAEPIFPQPTNPIFIFIPTNFCNPH